MLNFGNKRPPCAMEGCKEGGMLLIGHRFFCGKHAVEYKKIKDNKEQITIMEEMKHAGQ